ncbi:hypothetical protein OPV22_011431 [Ensete ventricosum]|uniref:Uncharacterized protein n=1 Tax=Ensete ventricosum TaxID=4639 RepID=A0AAV8RLC7_ENSVE|nr:hypothetical protein OPV22_011431 [Ensete ventricosum]
MEAEEGEMEATAPPRADPLPGANKWRRLRSRSEIIADDRIRCSRIVCDGQHTWTYVRGKFVSTMTTADGPRLGSSSCRDGGYLISCVFATFRRPPTVDGLRFGSSSRNDGDYWISVHATKHTVAR